MKKDIYAKSDKMKISIIMPAFNAASFIISAVQSVEAQTYGEWELLIINDGSTDDTEKKLRDYALNAGEEMQEKTRIISNEKNMGVSFSRNRGVAEADYDWIAFIDSDDLWTSDKLEKQIRLAEEKQADLVFSGCSYTDESGMDSAYILHVPEQIHYRELLKQNLISCSSVLVRKALLQKYKMENDEMHEDFAVWLQLLKNGYTAYGIDEPLLCYRVSAKSKSGNKKKAVVMTWRVYRYIGLGMFQRIYNLLFYFVRNIKKYRGIKKGFHRT